MCKKTKKVERQSRDAKNYGANPRSIVIKIVWFYWVDQSENNPRVDKLEKILKT